MDESQVLRHIELLNQLTTRVKDCPSVAEREAATSLAKEHMDYLDAFLKASWHNAKWFWVTGPEPCNFTLTRPPLTDLDRQVLRSLSNWRRAIELAKEEERARADSLLGRDDEIRRELQRRETPPDYGMRDYD